MAGLSATRRRFGLLGYRRTTNLGDEIQSLAARQFLPRVDKVLDRDRLDRRPGLGGRIELIMNGWHSRHPEAWPPHPAIIPLLTSIHLSDQPGPKGFSAAEALVVGRSAAYLREHGPIGARDLWTLEILRRNGIDSYFSGCLTFTLQRPADVAAGDYLVVNDLEDEVFDRVRRAASAPVIRTTHLALKPAGFDARMRLAGDLLRLYAGARGVVTSRLHCALPCLAMGTPVLLLAPRPGIDRLRGLEDLVRHGAADDFLGGHLDFDLKDPAPNDERHLGLRDALAAQCRHFVQATEADR